MKIDSLKYTPRKYVVLFFVELKYRHLIYNSKEKLKNFFLNMICFLADKINTHHFCLLEGGADLEMRGRHKGSLPMSMPKVVMEPQHSKSPASVQRGIRSRSPNRVHHMSELSRSMSPER